MNKNIFHTGLIFFISFTLLRGQSTVDIYNSALTAFRKNDYAKAYELFTAFLNNNDVDKDLFASAKYYTAESLIALNEYEGAIQELNSLVLDHNFVVIRPNALYRLGKLFFDLGEYENARKKLEQYLYEYPYGSFTGSVYYLIGESYVKENRYGEAIDFLKNAIEIKRKNEFVDHTIFSLANIYEKKGEYAKAVEYYDKLLAFYRKSKLRPYAQLRIGICYYKLGEYESAILELSDPLIDRLPQNFKNEAFFMLGQTYFAQNEFEKASKIFSGLIDGNTGKKFKNKIVYSLAWVHFKNNQYDKAYKLFENIAKLKSDTLAANALFWSAECKRLNGDKQEAVEIYNRFLEKYPQHRLAPKAKLNLGLAKLDKTDFSQSERDLISALGSSDIQTKAKANILLGNISLRKKDYNAAAKYFGDCVFLNPPVKLKDKALLGWGTALYYLNKPSRAIQELKKITIGLTSDEEQTKNFYLAESYFALGKYKKAIVYYNKIKSTNKELDGETLYGKAYAYFNAKDYANAAYLFRKFLNRFPGDKRELDAKTRLAESYFGVKDFDKAARLYKELIYKHKRLANSGESYYRYGQSLFQAGKSNEAIKVFQELQKKFPNSEYGDEAQYLIGWVHFQTGNFHEAIRYYEDLQTKYPRSKIIPVAIYSIGDAYFNLGEYERAIRKYMELIKRYPDTKYVFDAINGIIYCYEVTDRTTDAINFIDKIIQTNSQPQFNDKIFFKKGEIYYSIANYKSAIESYNEFIAKYPQSKLVPNAYYWIGKSAANLGNYDEALINYHKIINNYINSDIAVQAVIEAGTIYHKRENYDGEIELYEATFDKLKDKEGAAEIAFKKAEAFIQKNDIPAAYKSLLAVIEIYPGTVFSDEAKIELGIIELARKDYSKAEDLFREVAGSRKDDIGAKAQFYYGEALFLQNKIEDAVAAFVRVRSIFPAYDEWYSRSLLRLGDCYVKLNDTKNAKEMYSAVLKKHRSDKLGAEAKSKLKKL